MCFRLPPPYYNQLVSRMLLDPQAQSPHVVLIEFIPDEDLG